jgi:hypothetical protein
MQTHSSVVQTHRVSTMEWVATLMFIWGLTITTFDDFGFIGQDISRTRELTTSYVLIVVALTAAPWRRLDRVPQVAVAVLGVSIVLGFIVWQAQEDSSVAANYWSQWLLPLGMLLLGVGFGRRLWWLWRRVIIIYGVAIATIQAPLLALNWRYGEQSTGMESFYSVRPLGAPLALMMVLAVVMVMAEPRLNSTRRNLITAFLGVSVVISQHRSAWVALLIALVLLAARYVTQHARLSRWWSIPSVAGFFLVAALLPLLTPASLLPGRSSEGSALPDSFEATGTLSWRIEMWESRLQRARALGEWLFGGVFGATPVWGPGSDVMKPELTGHSMYVDLLTMLGIVGLVAFATLCFCAVFFSGNRLGELPIVVCSALGFGVFYAWPAWTWLLLGVALAVREYSGGDTVVCFDEPAEADGQHPVSRGRPGSVAGGAKAVGA